MRRAPRIAALLAACCTALAAPAAANAGLVASATGCPNQSYSQVFLPWGDVADYALVPGGDAESAAGWSLSGASVADGNEPWSVTGSGQRHVEVAGDGSAATTPSQCVGVGHPTVRFFVRSSGLDAGSYLRVEALVAGADGVVTPVRIGVVGSSPQWTPSAPYAIVANLLPLLPGNLTPVRFRYTAVGAGTWSLDDIHVDPFRGGGG